MRHCRVLQTYRSPSSAREAGLRTRYGAADRRHPTRQREALGVPDSSRPAAGSVLPVYCPVTIVSRSRARAGRPQPAPGRNVTRRRATASPARGAGLGGREFRLQLAHSPAPVRPRAQGGDREVETERKSSAPSLWLVGEAGPPLHRPARWVAGTFSASRSSARISAPGDDLRKWQSRMSTRSNWRLESPEPRKLRPLGRLCYGAGG